MPGSRNGSDRSGPASGTPSRTQEEIDRLRAETAAQLAAERVERPDVEPLDLPHRRYYLPTF